MNINILIAFLFGMIILSATPGPGVFASMSKAISNGFTASLYLIGGLVIGDIIFLLLALFGLSAIAKIMGWMFLFIKIIGGIYLIYLGIKIFRSVLLKENIEGQKEDQSRQSGAITDNRFQTFLGGFVVTLGNPKPILFYASVLPTIINFNEVKPLEVFIMVLLIALVSFIVLGTYSCVASLSHKLNINGRWNKRINQVAGIVMMVAGLLVIAN
jgi:threonine/homoserine/homoserine lactone efflux protein